MRKNINSEAPLYWHFCVAAFVVVVGLMAAALPASQQFLTSHAAPHFAAGACSFCLFGALILCCKYVVWVKIAKHNNNINNECQEKYFNKKCCAHVRTFSVAFQLRMKIAEALVVPKFISGVWQWNVKSEKKAK